jgi:hypothetical protein
MSWATNAASWNQLSERADPRPKQRGTAVESLSPNRFDRIDPRGLPGRDGDRDCGHDRQR